jgi:lambda family phage portal protein
MGLLSWLGFGGKRAYAAAVDGRSTTWRDSGASATAEVGAAALTVARRAREAVRNNPYGARIVDLWAGNAVGAGITTTWTSEPHADAWKRWAGGLDCDAEGHLHFAALQALVMRGVVESGEVFVRFQFALPSAANPVGLRLQVLESDFLDTSRNGVINGENTVQGIGLDNAGRPAGYWLYKFHPGNSWIFEAAAVQSVRVPADDVMHIFRKRRPGQLRDVSWLAPVLAHLRDLSEYEAALLQKAKIEACLVGAVTDDGEGVIGAASTSGSETQSSDGLFRDARGNVVETFEPGLLLYRRTNGAGSSFEAINPSSSGSHVSLARRALEAAAVGVGLTYDQVAGDLTQANYSSLRAGKIEFRRLCEQVQYGMLIPMLISRTARRFHAQGAMRGLWASEMPDGVEHVPPPHEMIDPLKDTTALIAQVRAGFVPLSEAVAGFGYTVAETVERYKADNVMLDKAGVALDTDPRRVAKSGAAQDAAQIAAIEIAATGAAQPRREPATEVQE